MDPKRCRLFVYGTLLKEHPGHPLLGGAELERVVRTEATFELVDLGAYAALVPGGTTAVAGELYVVDLETRARIDRERQVPLLFERARIRLEDGTEAEAYVMSADRVRGRRRLRHGDWRKRFAPTAPRPAPSPFVTWARGRFSKS
jgi:gamma-glutamylaminecyclotransferase